MPNILIYNTGSGDVIDYLISVDEQQYIDRNDILIQPSIPAVDKYYWKVENGNVRECTTEEVNIKLSASLSQVDPLTSFSQKLDNLTKDGYYDATLDITIKGDNRAMTERWTPQAVSVLNMKSLGMPGSTTLTTYTYDDAPITLTFDQFQGLMARYTVWFSTKFAEAATP